MRIVIRPQSRRGRREWVVDWNVNGQRRRIVRATKREAEIEAEQLRHQVAEAGQAWMLLQPPERQELMDVYRDVAAAGLRLRDVWAGYRAAQAKPVQSVRLDAALKAFLAQKRASGHRPAYVVSLDEYLSMFIRGREAAQVASITPQSIRDWFGARSEAPASQRSNQGRLASFFAYCQRQGWTSQDSCSDFEPIRLTYQPPSALRVRQAARLLAMTLRRHPPMLPWIVLGLFAGVRPGEIERMSWQDIDLDAGIARIEAAASKVRQRRIVHLMPPAKAWLTLAKTRGNPVSMPKSTRRRHLRALRCDMGWSSWPQDVLRHTAASYLVAHHQDAGRVALELGNSPGVLLRNYRAIVSQDDSRRFWAVLPKPRHVKTPC